MRGKGGEILFDGLIVADIGEYRVEDWHLGAVSGNRNSGLRHHGQQSERFQGDGFAAGVGAGDHKLPAVAFEFDGDGNDLGVL